MSNRESMKVGLGLEGHHAADVIGIEGAPRRLNGRKRLHGEEGAQLFVQFLFAGKDCSRIAMAAAVTMKAFASRNGLFIRF